jgi:RNA polymerase sigma-70 factor (ECF subfamily)
LSEAVEHAITGRDRRSSLCPGKALTCLSNLGIRSRLQGSQTEWGDTNLLHYIDGLYGYAMLLTRDATEAEDLVQETYFCAIPRVASLRVGSKPEELAPRDSSKYLARAVTARRRCAQDCRIRNVRTLRISSRIRCEPVRARSDAGCDSTASCGVSRDHPVARVEELSSQEISEILNCPPGTVMSCLARARTKLRALLSSVADPSLMEGRQR